MHIQKFKIWKYVSPVPGGCGFVREICDLIVKLVLKDKSEYDMPYLNAQVSFPEPTSAGERMGRRNNFSNFQR